MKREDKKSLYIFLDTAKSWASGGAEPRSAVPDFSDDPEPEDGSFLAENPTLRSAIPEAIPGETLATIAEKIAACERCQLCATRKNTVPGIGASSPSVMVIGEGPGADEDAKGEPFVGKAGQLLDKMLYAIGLSRNTNCFIANIVKCRPPQNRDPLPDESAACAPYLESQIAILKPKAILAVGRIAAHNLLGTTRGIGQLHGNFYDYHGIPLMPTYHPSALLRDENLKRPAWEDLKKFRSELLGLDPVYAQNQQNPGKTGNN